MRVLVDLLFWTGTRGGMESCVREIYRRIADESPDLQFVGLASRELIGADEEWFPGRLIDSGVPGSHRLRWAWGELTIVNRQARRVGADLIHAPANVGPITGRTRVALTMHDVLPVVHPEWVPGAYGRALTTFLAASARHASRILTVSEASRADIVKSLHPRAPIDVIPLAGPETEAPSSARRQRSSFITVANAMPHKNLHRLVEVFARPELAGSTLTIYGSSRDQGLVRTIREYAASNIVVAGWVTDDELDVAYRNATALLLPTRFEGFGLPVLEALARSCPVICSDLPVLREVAGDAARFVDPDDVDGWVSSIVAVAAQPPDPGALRARSEKFSWAAAAAGTAESLRRAALGA